MCPQENMLVVLIKITLSWIGSARTTKTAHFPKMTIITLQTLKTILKFFFSHIKQKVFDLEESKQNNFYSQICCLELFQYYLDTIKPTKVNNHRIVRSHKTI